MEAMEVVSLIDVVEEGARKEMGNALKNLGKMAAKNERTANDYLRALLRLTGIVSRDNPDPRAWLETNTEAIGKAISAMERVLGSEIARQLTSSVLKSSFTNDITYKVDSGVAGYIRHLPKDPKRGNRLLADCDVYAVYGMRLLRAQGWKTVGYFSFQHDKPNNGVTHVIGLARREANGIKEYLVVDSEAFGNLQHIGNKSDDEAAKGEAAKSGDDWDYHYYAPAINDGEFDPRLSNFHPAKLRYP